MNEELNDIDISCYGKNMFELIKTLFPICRSITGNGVRKTLKIIKELIPVEIKEIASGTKVFDWTIPKEWNITDAYIKNSEGEKIIDFKKSNLHVLNYSVPVHKKLNLRELKDHLYTLPDHPDWIPYLTSYYKENWGFCLSDNQLKELKEETYEVLIDSTLKDGSLTYGEVLLKGECEEQIIISCYICHPSLCNDNLSGPVLVVFLVKYLMMMNNIRKLKYTYRFLFIPETIGSITWLFLNEKDTPKIKYGLVATCLGDPGKFTYKKSRIGNALIDKIAEKVLIDSGIPFEIVDFFPSGSDERQFCSPGFNLPIGSLMRTPYGRFAEYHTSADNLDFVRSEYLADSIMKYISIIFIIENNTSYLNLNPKCEPQLGKRGLYGSIGSQKKEKNEELAMLWILNLSDGNNSLLDISFRSKISFKQIKNVADILVENNLLIEIKND